MFGKTQRGVSERPHKSQKALIPNWLWTLFGILVLMSCGVALMLWQPWQPVAKQDPVAINQEQEKNEQDYRFYELLPQQQVTPIPDQAVPENKNRGTVMVVEAPDVAEQAASEPGLVVAKSHYILQAGSFDNPDQADARRAEIILNGLSADVVEVMQDDHAWYRVISGPYDSQDAAIIAQQSLQHSSIDSIVVKR